MGAIKAAIADQADGIRRLRPTSSAGMLTDYTTVGVSRRPIHRGSRGGNMQLKVHIYDAEANYKAGDIVTRGASQDDAIVPDSNPETTQCHADLRAGGIAGTYLCIKACTGVDPKEPSAESNEHWVTLARGAWDTMALKFGGGKIIFNKTDPDPEHPIDDGMEVDISMDEITPHKVKFRKYKYCKGGKEYFVWLLGTKLIDPDTGDEVEILDS